MAPAAVTEPSPRSQLSATDETRASGSTDLRLLPCGLAGWAAGWWAPLLPTVAAAWVVGSLVVVAGAMTMRRIAHQRAAADAERRAAADVHLRDPEDPVTPEARSWAWSVVAAAVVGAGVLAVATLGAARAEASVVDELAAEHAVITGELRITGDARLAQTEGAPGQPLWVVPAVIEVVTGRGQRSAASAPVVVLATDPAWTTLIPSTTVQVTGRLAPNDRISREVAVLRASRAPEVVAQPSRIQRAAEHLRAGLRAAVTGLSPDARGLLPGLVVGDESLLPPDLADDAKTTGLTHLTAVSGTNVC